MFHKLWGTGHPWPPTIPLLIISQYSLGEDFSWLTLAVSGVILAFEVGQQKFFFWKGKREKRKIRSLAVSRRGPQERTSVDSAERQSDWHKINILSHLWCALYGHYLKIHFCFTTCPFQFRSGISGCDRQFVMACASFRELKILNDWPNQDHWSRSLLWIHLQ